MNIDGAALNIVMNHFGQKALSEAYDVLSLCIGLVSARNLRAMIRRNYGGFSQDELAKTLGSQLEILETVGYGAGTEEAFAEIIAYASSVGHVPISRQPVPFSYFCSMAFP